MFLNQLIIIQPISAYHISIMVLDIEKGNKSSLKAINPVMLVFVNIGYCVGCCLMIGNTIIALHLADGLIQSDLQ